MHKHNLLHIRTRLRNRQVSLLHKTVTLVMCTLTSFSSFATNERTRTPQRVIADVQRHSPAAYNDLSKIASTLILKNRGKNNQENLESAMKIDVVLNKEQEMTSRIEQHKSATAEYKTRFASSDTMQFAIATEKGMWLHSPESYAGSVLTHLGIRSPIPNETKRTYVEISLEQLLKKMTSPPSRRTRTNIHSFATQRCFQA